MATTSHNILFSLAGAAFFLLPIPPCAAEPSYVWNGSSLAEVNDDSSLTCSNWAVWYFDNSSITLMPGHQWGEDSAKSPQDVLEEQKQADRDDRAYARFFNQPYPPTKFGHQKFLAPICIEKTSFGAQPAALAELDALDEDYEKISDTIDKIEWILGLDKSRFATEMDFIQVTKDAMERWKNLHENLGRIAQLHNLLQRGLDPSVSWLDSSLTGFAKIADDASAYGHNISMQQYPTLPDTTRAALAPTTKSSATFHAQNPNGNVLDASTSVTAGSLTYDQRFHRPSSDTHVNYTANLTDVHVTNLIRRQQLNGSAPPVSFELYVTCRNSYANCMNYSEAVHYLPTTNAAPGVDRSSNENSSYVSIELGSEEDARALCAQINADDNSICNNPFIDQ